MPVVAVWSGSSFRLVLAQTSRGSLLTTIAFREEDTVRTADRATNDDVILGCCIHWQRGSAGAAPASARAVLVSNDANLRVKALAVDVPAIATDKLAALLQVLARSST